jgi:hypothetical protein
MEMRRALLLLMLPALAQAASDISYHVEPVSCTSGPYGLKLPDSYEALKRIGSLRGERVLPLPQRREAPSEGRELSFAGLKLLVQRKASDAGNYRVLSADISAGGWKIAGPFKVGALLPGKVGDVDTKSLSGRGVIEFIGEGNDIVRIRRSGRRVSGITYLCHVE